MDSDNADEDMPIVDNVSHEVEISDDVSILEGIRSCGIRDVAEDTPCGLVQRQRTCAEPVQSAAHIIFGHEELTDQRSNVSGKGRMFRDDGSHDLFRSEELHDHASYIVNKDTDEIDEANRRYTMDDISDVKENENTDHSTFEAIGLPSISALSKLPFRKRLSSLQYSLDEDTSSRSDLEGDEARPSTSRKMSLQETSRLTEMPWRKRLVSQFFQEEEKMSASSTESDTEKDIFGDDYVEEVYEFGEHFEMMIMSFQRFQSSGEQCDAIFNVKNQDFKAHRLILAASSEHFKEKFLPKAIAVSCILDFREYEPWYFICCLRYFYTGKMLFTDQYVEIFLQMFRRFKLHDLINEFMEFLIKRLSKENCHSLLSNANRYNVQQKFREKIFEFVDKSFPER